MSWKVEVHTTQCRPDEWTGNAIRLGSFDEAEGYAKDLKSRWLLVKHYRIVQSDDPVNYTWNPEAAKLIAGVTRCDDAQL